MAAVWSSPFLTERYLAQMLFTLHIRLYFVKMYFLLKMFIACLLVCVFSFLGY